ncbi:MAG: LptF/LptG family permease [Bacteroidales bacterium]|nr:LptF/LptG family permease [Bacteroidales bacterium]
MKKLDIYITRKFLGTFIFSIVLILGVAVVFDLSEKLDNFIDHQAPFKAVVFEYYMNFIPYFAILFSSLFVFISVIYFTSKMAYNSEIIAIISNGISFYRLLVPYMFSALVIALGSFLISNFLLPHANARRLAFEEEYVGRTRNYRSNTYNIHRQVRPNLYVYMQSYSPISKVGQKFSMEKFDEKGRLQSKMVASSVRWDTAICKWNARNYYIRVISDSLHEKIEKGSRIDTTFFLTPKDLASRKNITETLNLGELKQFVRNQRLQGAENIEEYEIALYNRFSSPFSAFILTLIGLSLSARKMKGGIGVQIGTGIALSFTYILFMQFSSQFAIGGNMDPILASWLPNIIFAVIAMVVFFMTPK